MFGTCIWPVFRIRILLSGCGSDFLSPEQKNPDPEKNTRKLLVKVQQHFNYIQHSQHCPLLVRFLQHLIKVHHLELVVKKSWYKIWANSTVFNIEGLLRKFHTLFLNIYIFLWCRSFLSRFKQKQVVPDPCFSSPDLESLIGEKTWIHLDPK